MASIKGTVWNRWVLPFLCINVTVLVVVPIAVRGESRDLLKALAYALIYANLAGAFGVLAIQVLITKLEGYLPLVVVVAGGVIVCTAIGSLIAQFLFMQLGFQVPRQFWADYLETLRIGMPFAIVFGLGVFMHASLRERVREAEQKLHEKEIAEERIRKLAAEARLRSLEAQLHPHFLFNTLNSIMSLIPQNPTRAEQIAGRLAVLLRSSLDNSNQSLISLRQEFAMVESYLDIERVRFGDRLRGEVLAPAALLATRVPPLSVQSLVENAIKHGVMPQQGTGEVRVCASKIGDELQVEIRDNGPGFDLSAVPAGHGLNNLVERLDAIFGPKARLKVLHDEGFCVVRMILPLV